MLRFVGRLLRVELVAVLLLAGPASLPAFAQGKDKDKEKGEPVTFETADGVILKGLFYPSAKRQAAPGTVLMLHSLGDNSQKKDWKDLAEELQKKEFAVLIFDFRGHGQSTDVNAQQFWANPFDLSQYNQRLVKGYNPANPKPTIGFKDFDKRYYPVLINDIAAAKAYLDRKNDSRECNTSNFIVIGAQEGATLGALWMHSEYYRYRVIEEAAGLARLERLDKTPEGKDVICLVSLSMSSSLGGRPIRFSSVLHNAGKVKATPMLFLYGEKDDSGGNTAKACANNIKSGAKDKEKYAFTGAFKVPETNLKGMGLLTKGLPTTKDVVKYLTNVTSEKNNEWYARDHKKTKFVWVSPLVVIAPGSILVLDGRTFFMAKPVGEMSLLFDTYERFIPR